MEEKLERFQKFQQDFYMLWGQITIFYSRWAEKIGINYTTLMILCGLDVHGSMTQKNICNYYGFPKQTVNGTIHRLVDCGYVDLKKNSADKREKLAVLTERGKEYVKEKLTPLYEAEQHAFFMIGDEKMFRMLEAMDAFGTLLGRRLEGER